MVMNFIPVPGDSRIVHQAILEIASFGLCVPDHQGYAAVNEQMYVRYQAGMLHQHNVLRCLAFSIFFSSSQSASCKSTPGQILRGSGKTMVVSSRARTLLDDRAPNINATNHGCANTKMKFSGFGQSIRIKPCLIQCWACLHRGSNELINSQAAEKQSGSANAHGCDD